MPEADGWEYQLNPKGGDCRKIVTLDQDGMCWVGIRAYNAATGRWLNGGEPERATVLAWRDLDQPARGRWVNGRLVLGRIEFSLEGTGFTLKECGCTEGFCDDLTDGTCREGQPARTRDDEAVAWGQIVQLLLRAMDTSPRSENVAALAERMAHGVVALYAAPSTNAQEPARTGDGK